MVEENISHELRLKTIDETKNYFLEEMEQNEVISRKYKKVCATMNYIEHLLILASLITGCISVSTFDSLLGMSSATGWGIMSSATGLKICAMTAGIKCKGKSII